MNRISGKIKFILFSVAFLSGFWVFHLQAQQPFAGNNFAILKPGSSEQEIIETAAHITPSARQLARQRLETTAFVHFGMNTFYQQEWGKGTEDPARFAPAMLNTDQWAKVLSEAGLNMLIFTCKHHDGFCLWPSKYTEHTVAASPWMNGKGDLVKQVSESCRKYNLKFGIYLSPWDKHEPCYGNSTGYNNFFLNQLRELLTNYGTVDEVWFDGACGEGPNGKKQVYDWNSYYSLIRKLQPNAVIAVMGPDVRWVGTESGYGRETEWSVVPYDIANQDEIAEHSQQTALNQGFTPTGDMVKPDVGSRNVIRDAKSLIWYPSEVDVSIRPGWFWHENENASVKTPEKLLDIYFSSVGRNSLLLLNIPPDMSGRINDADIKSLKAWKNALLSIFKENFAEGAIASENGNALNINDITDKIDTTYWDLKGHIPTTFQFDLKKVSDFDVLLLQENIRIGQRIEHFTLDAWINGDWKLITEGTTVGFKRLLRFPEVHTDKIRLTIDQSRLVPALAELGLYLQLPTVSAYPSSASFSQSIKVVLTSNAKDAAIFYTTNGSIPDTNSIRYDQPVIIDKTTVLNSIAIRKNGTVGFSTKSEYNKAGFNITLLNSPDAKYGANGPLGLVDGKHGTIDFADGNWSGFQGTDLVAILDLESIRDLHEFAISFNESTRSWIFRPQHLEFAVSEDGISYTTILTKSFIKPEIDNEELIPVSFSFACRARFVKIIAVNYGKLPAWHPGFGEPAWLFADEISIR